MSNTKVEQIQSIGLFDSVKQEMKNAIDVGINLLESEQAKINRAIFETMTMAQRDSFCQNLNREGVKPARLEKITGKSQSTVNRHLNKKNT